MSFRRSATALTTVALCAVALTACTGSPSTESATEPAPVVPTTIENCGVDVAVSPVPERVVTVKSSPLELLLALGLEDRVVGSAFLDGPVPDGLAPAGWEPTVMADELPAKEMVLAATPDLVFAGWESNLSADGIGTRADLATFGIRTYIAPPACTFGADSSSTPTSFDDVFSMFTEVGEIFDVEDAAAKLVATQRSELAAITTPASSPSVLWYSSGTDAPFVAGGTGVPAMMMSAAGLTSVTAADPHTWFSMPWESFIAADPDIIVLVDAPWNTAADKRAHLESTAATKGMRAVKQSTYLVIDFAATEGGVRNVSAVAQLAADATRLLPTK